MRGGARRRRLDGAGRLGGEASDGEVAPARFGRWEASWELREVEARLKVGAIGVERFWGGGSAAG